VYSLVFITATVRPLSAGKIVTDVSLARSLSAFSSSLPSNVVSWMRTPIVMVMVEVTEVLIRSLSASGS